jgi:hypothetical protein
VAITFLRVVIHCRFSSVFRDGFGHGGFDLSEGVLAVLGGGYGILWLFFVQIVFPVVF